MLGFFILGMIVIIGLHVEVDGVSLISQSPFDWFVTQTIVIIALGLIYINKR